MAAIQYESIEAMGQDHYDVCIVGVWYGLNYGSTLTYYALQKVIRSLGYSVLVLEKPGLSNDWEMAPAASPRVFANQHYQAISPQLAIEDFAMLNDYCDSFVVGSDQIWFYNISEFQGTTFHLGFVAPSKKRVSYATSFGHETSGVTQDAISDIARELSLFDHISVREDSGIRILWEEFGALGDQVLDPVFLLDARSYEALESTAERPEGPYLLAYVLDPKDGMQAVLSQIADELGLSVVIAADSMGNASEGNDIPAYEAVFGCEDVRLCPNVESWLALFGGVLCCY